MQVYASGIPTVQTAFLLAKIVRRGQYLVQEPQSASMVRFAIFVDAVGVHRN